MKNYLCLSGILAFAFAVFGQSEKSENYAAAVDFKTHNNAGQYEAV